MKQARSISFSRGKGKLTHTDRSFIPDNVDPERIQNNIILVNETLSEAYDKVFGEAQAEYNAKQKRKDRKIDDYFCKLFGVPATDQTATEVLKNKNKQQSFYEWVIGVGSSYDTGIVDWVNNEGATIKANPHAARIAAECLTEYIVGNPEIGVPSYDERNPNFHLMKAIVHMDEKTPHLHIDAVPFADGYKNGMTRQQGIAKALDVMGYGIGETAIAKWQESERAVFRKICENHGFTIRDEEKSRGYTVLTRQYGEYHENELALARQEQEIADNQQQLEQAKSDREAAERAAEQARADREANEQAAAIAVADRDAAEQAAANAKQAAEQAKSDRKADEHAAEHARTELAEIQAQTAAAKAELAEMQEQALAYDPDKKHFAESQAAYAARVATAQQATAVQQRTVEQDARQKAQDERDAKLDAMERNIDAISVTKAKELAAKPIADARRETAAVRSELIAEQTAHSQTKSLLHQAWEQIRTMLLAKFAPYWKNTSMNAHEKFAETLRRGETNADIQRGRSYQSIAQEKPQGQTQPGIYRHR